jgi:beta-galactosidase
MGTAGGPGATNPTPHSESTPGNGIALDNPGSTGATDESPGIPSPRTRVLFNDAWRFTKGDPPVDTSSLAYARARPWVLPTSNAFIKDPARRTTRPEANLGNGVPYVAADYDDGTWQSVTLPHDYAIVGPYTTSVSGSMGHLPSAGIVWYRKTLSLAAEDAGKSVFLDLDGAMSFSLVWLNGRFVGGWPYGYASYRVDLTPYLKPGEDNVLAIRLDNPQPADANWQSGSSRWYPGGGIYRNVWLVKTAPVHVGQWGTKLTTPEVSAASARVELEISVDNDSNQAATVSLATSIFELDREGRRADVAVASLPPAQLQIPARSSATSAVTGTIDQPKLWGTGPNQAPNRYAALTTLERDGAVVDAYETRFGVRTLSFDANAGFFLNGEHIKLNGVCNHHDLGALGAAVNSRALQRQLELLAEMGSNAIRTSHNPPAPELLELADRLGFLILDEAFDVWAAQKAALDHHTFFAEWHEQDLRAMLRRDRNHPSVVMWSIGNEIVEQQSGAAGAAVAAELTGICHEEDATRPTVSGMNSASATSPFPAPIDAVGLNYQGTGVRSGPPQYPVFHASFPQKFVVGTETTDTLSSRGVYTFPVAAAAGVPAAADAGQDNAARQVSSYDLYFAPWSYAPDQEFASQDAYPFVGGEFVWTGFDYLGEPTPFDSSRSSYSGIFDLAGFKKDRFYLYQAYWRPELPMAHLLPHWTWPERVGQVTPVHVYTSGDEAELFLNGRSLGRKRKGPSEYRLRWDDVLYEPGELGVVAYKGGVEWGTDSVQTAGAASGLRLTPDRATIAGDGRDLSYVTLSVVDANGNFVPRAQNPVSFEVSGPGEIVATDNGDPTDLTVFPSRDRRAFNGLAIALVRASSGQTGEIVVTARSAGLPDASVVVVAQ